MQTDVKELLHEQIALKRKISIIEKQLEGHVAEMRIFMANNGYKKIEMQGFRMTYSYPRKYSQMIKTKQEVIKERMLLILFLKVFHASFYRLLTTEETTSLTILI